LNHRTWAIRNGSQSIRLLRTTEKKLAGHFANRIARIVEVAQGSQHDGLSLGNLRLFSFCKSKRTKVTMSQLKFLETPGMKRKLFRVIVYSIVGSYLLFCAHFHIWQEWYLLDPKNDPTDMIPSKYEGQGTPFTLPKTKDDDGEIHYRRYTTTIMPIKGTVFYLHGNRGDMDRCECEIDFLLDRGYDVWTMDYRGFGDSIGTMSESALKEDASQVYAKIKRRDLEKPLIVWGRSFGSGVAASVAAEALADDKPDLLILETPYWSLVDLAQQKCPILPSQLFRYELPVHEFLKSAGCPIHLIHGTRDEKINANASDRLLELKSESIEIQGHSIMGGMHNLRNDRSIVDFEEKVDSILK
jgi:pimeloyl-ACP methyl ester carboxylesterase